MKKTWTHRAGLPGCRDRVAYMKAYYAQFREKYVQYAREHRDHSRDLQFKRRYGISLAEANRLKSNPCGICWSEAQAIDHNHKTKRVRGALCGKCNTGLGMFHDNPHLLRFAAKYLEAA